MALAGTALGGVITVPSQAAPLSTAAPVATGTSNALTSHNWSGYEQTGGKYHSVSATWTVPAVTSSGSTTTDSSTWVGIDGSHKNDPLIQTGTEQGWNGHTRKPFYHAWMEVLPAQKSEVVKFQVSVGDNIYASVSQLNNAQWQIYLLDRNSGKTISQVVNYQGPQSSAEFIQEAPRNKYGNLWPIAKTTVVTFRNARVNGAGARLFIAQRATMFQSGKQVSTPSYPNREQTGFTVAAAATVPGAPETPLMQRHSDGSVWASTGAACRSGGCPGWVKLDNNAATISVSAGAGSIYQLHRDGSIWEWMGGACKGSSCPGWLLLDANKGSSSISAGTGQCSSFIPTGASGSRPESPASAPPAPAGLNLTTAARYRRPARSAPGTGRCSSCAAMEASGGGTAGTARACSIAPDGFRLTTIRRPS